MLSAREILAGECRVVLCVKGDRHPYVRRWHEVGRHLCCARVFDEETTDDGENRDLHRRSTPEYLEGMASWFRYLVFDKSVEELL